MKSIGMFRVCFLCVVVMGCQRNPEEVGVKETKRETLGRHETVAGFQGVSEHTCRGMTALCPDRCGHSGRMATFKIIEYIQFDKLSEHSGVSPCIVALSPDLALEGLGNGVCLCRSPSIFDGAIADAVGLGITDLLLSPFMKGLVVAFEPEDFTIAFKRHDVRG